MVMCSYIWFSVALHCIAFRAYAGLMQKCLFFLTRIVYPSTSDMWVSDATLKFFEKLWSCRLCGLFLHEHNCSCCTFWRAPAGHQPHLPPTHHSSLISTHFTQLGREGFCSYQSWSYHKFLLFIYRGLTEYVGNWFILVLPCLASLWREVPLLWDATLRRMWNLITMSSSHLTFHGQHWINSTKK